MADDVHYPTPGCVVEYLEGNSVRIAVVTEESGGKLRLLLPNRRETRLSPSRLLPWLGPLHDAELNRDAFVRLLEEHRKTREDLACAVPVMEAWELAQGEMSRAPARWFAELFHSDPTADHVAAYGHALLACKSHFRFQPPDFLVFTAEEAEKRRAEQKARTDREALVAGGAAFFRLLWDVACKKRRLPPASASDSSGSDDWPSPEVGARLKALLRERMVNPDAQESDTLWHMLVKGLPETPHMPLQLLVAWGELPPHHNFWLDRAGYAADDDWWREAADEVAAFEAANGAAASALPVCDLPFVSIDSESTRDVDDAFFVESAEGGYALTLALACPALNWPFGGALDRLALHRGTSLYLPEGTYHMLPERLGADFCSLTSGASRPALCVRLVVERSGRLGSCELFLARVRLAANLTYRDCEAVLLSPEGAVPADNPAAAHAGLLRLGLTLGEARQAARIADGAIVMDKPEPYISLEGEGEDVRVHITPAPPTPKSSLLVAETMIAASAAVARWGGERGIPLLHRTQDVPLPGEYAGVWTAPQDMARIMRALIPSSLEVQPRRHAALAMDAYAPVTSPLRRYSDLVNEAQVVHFLTGRQPRWDRGELASLLNSLSPVLEAVGQVQRFRPRYWKLLYFRQQGDKMWWPGVITEENDAFVSVSLPEQALFVRGRRQLFDERACPGMEVMVRLGKINPLWNEVQIMDVAPAEQA